MNSFEEKIKNRLGNYNSDIDPNEIWESIQKKRYPNKRMHRIVFFMFAASILLLLSGTLIIIKTSTPEKPKDNRSIVNNEIDTKANNKLSGNNNENVKPYVNTRKSNSSSSKKEEILQKNNLSHSLHRYKIITKNKIDDFDIKIKDPKDSLINNKQMAFFDKSIAIAKIKTISTLSYNNITPKYIFTPTTFIHKTKLKTKPTIELSFTPNYVLNHFTLVNNNSKTFMNNKREKEKYLEAFDVFLTYKQAIYNNISIYTGINYGQIDTKLNFSYIENKTEEIDSALTKVIINSIEDTLEIYERALVKSYYDVTEKIYNYHRYLRVPIFISYSGEIKNMHYELRTGIDLNIFTSNKGRAITPEGKTTMIKNTKINLLKLKTFGDLHLDFRIAYNLNNHTIFVFGPQYKVSLDSQMQKSAGLNLYHHSFGINMGIKYKI